MNDILEELKNPITPKELIGENKGEKDIKKPPVKRNREKIILTTEQGQAILKCWNDAPADEPRGLQDLLDVAWPGEKIDFRSPKGLAVRGFISTRKEIKYRKARDYISDQDIELTEEIKEFIIRNAASKSATQIAREITGNPELMSTTKAVKRIIEFVRSLNREILGTTVYAVDKECDSGYDAPKSFYKLVPKINEYTEGARLDHTKLSSRQQKDCQSLIGYLHKPRFIYQINSYTKRDDRRLFEACFINWTYDKPDLTQEDLDMYIVWATEVVMSHNIQKQINMLQGEQDILVQSGERISMALIEAINSARDEYNNSIARQT
ncbi:MAG: hypothetical protein AABY22_20930, partial [Nanoarchaeota archaeon]